MEAVATAELHAAKLLSEALSTETPSAAAVARLKNALADLLFAIELADAAAPLYPVDTAAEAIALHRQQYQEWTAKYRRLAAEARATAQAETNSRASDEQEEPERDSADAVSNQVDGVRQRRATVQATRAALFQGRGSAGGAGAGAGLAMQHAVAAGNTLAMRQARDTLAAEVERLSAVSDLVSRDGALLRRSYSDQSAYGGEVVESRHRVKQYKNKEAVDRAYIATAFWMFAVVAACIVLKRLLWTFLGVRLPWPLA